MEWKDEFLRLFTSPSIKEFSAALELKSQHLPKKLYRYRSMSKECYALNEIKTGEIYLATYHELNDLYDGSSVMGNDFPEPYLGDLGKKKTREVVQENLSDEKIEAIFKEEKWLDFVVPYVLGDISDDQKEQTIKALKRVIMDFWERAHKDFNEMVRKLCRVTCFTTKQDNLPMWNFYADGYKGVVLEYETAKIEWPFLQNCLFPVSYSEKMPDVFDPKLKMFDCFNKISLIYYVMFHKFSDWSYEDEWRLIYNLGLFVTDLESVPESDWDTGKKLFFAYPSRVLMGPKICPEMENLVYQACDPLGIPVIRMKSTEYGLKEYT